MLAEDVSFDAVTYAVQVITPVSVMLRRVGWSITAPHTITLVGPFGLQDYASGGHYEVLIRRAQR